MPLWAAAAAARAAHRRFRLPSAWARRHGWRPCCRTRRRGGAWRALRSGSVAWTLAQTAARRSRPSMLACRVRCCFGGQALLAYCILGFVETRPHWLTPRLLPLTSLRAAELAKWVTSDSEDGGSLLPLSQHERVRRPACACLHAAVPAMHVVCMVGLASVMTVMTVIDCACLSPAARSWRWACGRRSTRPWLLGSRWPRSIWHSGWRERGAVQPRACICSPCKCVSTVRHVCVALLPRL